MILGQDPYHGPGQAHGLCFSVKRPVNPPPSLINMYKLLEKDIDGFQRPKHGCLVGWSKQGVLLLNACLTVRQAQANSHKDQVCYSKVLKSLIYTFQVKRDISFICMNFVLFNFLIMTLFLCLLKFPN